LTDEPDGAYSVTKPEKANEEVRPMPLLTATEAASFLCLHVVTVRDKARAGEVPALRLGRQWRFEETVLREWLHRGCPTRRKDPTLFE